MTQTYQRAFTEVYEILIYLDEEYYNKIPTEIIKAIEENRDTEYTFYIDESIPFVEQNLLEETKAILFNLYRDYLAKPEIKDKILQYQKEEKHISEKIKQEKFDYKNIFKNNSVNHIEKNNSITKNVQNNLIEVKKNKNIFTRIIKRIKKLLSSKFIKKN